MELSTISDVESGGGEQVSIAFGVTLPRGRPFIQVRELRRDNCRLKSVEPKVPSDELVMVFRFGAMGAQAHELLGTLRIVREDHSTVPRGTKIL